MKLFSFSEFIAEAEDSKQRARQKLQKANKKSDNFGSKQRAAQEEIKFRKDQVEYENKKDKIKNDINSATNNTDKGKARDAMASLKLDWKVTKKRAKDRIQRLRNVDTA